MCAEIYNRKSVNRTGRPLSRSYPPVRLDLTDVTNLQDLLRRLCGRATLYTGNLALRDCNQLKKSGKEILHDLRLEGDNPQISIVLRHDYVRVYIEEDFVFAEQAFLEIERILKRCYRRIAGIFTNYYVIIFGSLALIGAGIATWYSTGGLLRPLLLSIITLMYAALSIFNYKVEKVYSTILLTKDKHHIR